MLFFTVSELQYYFTFHSFFGSKYCITVPSSKNFWNITSNLFVLVESHQLLELPFLVEVIGLIQLYRQLHKSQ